MNNKEAIEKAIKSLEKESKKEWIPVRESLPNDTDLVLISYYDDEEKNNLTDAAHYSDGKWYWDSPHCQNWLDEFGSADSLIDNIKILAWMPLPDPYTEKNFRNVKEHIALLATDYKCCDERLTHDEALELYHILKQNPKKGHWLEEDITFCGVDLTNYKCANCGEIGGTWRKGLKPNELPKYCSSCGSRMEG